MAGTGGKRKGAGRKTKAEELQANTVMLNALKVIYGSDEDEKTKHIFIKDLYETERGKMFIAEHLFGKAPQEVKNTNLNIDASDMTPEEIKEISEELENAY